MAERSGKPAHIRLPDELHAQVAAYAKATNRPITNAIVYLVGVGLAAEQPQRRPAVDPTIHTR
jgi:hypothetical protein